MTRAMLETRPMNGFSVPEDYELRGDVDKVVFPVVG